VAQIAHLLKVDEHPDETTALAMVSEILEYTNRGHPLGMSSASIAKGLTVREVPITIRRSASRSVGIARWNSSGNFLRRWYLSVTPREFQ